MQTMGFVLFGYLSGSVLYARVFLRMFKREDMLERSRDKNPGTANAFGCGGFWCGLMTLGFDILKGFLPVYLYMWQMTVLRMRMPVNPVVLAAPVVGHAFPVFYRFEGGKGIAVTFGCLLGLLPVWQPVIILAACFIFYSVILCITPHFYRTVVSYISAFAGMACTAACRGMVAGFLMILAIVCIRMHLSTEEREKMRVKLLWMH